MTARRVLRPASVRRLLLALGWTPDVLFLDAVRELGRRAGERHLGGEIGAPLARIEKRPA